jgi:hypothetical protein
VLADALIARFCLHFLRGPLALNLERRSTHVMIDVSHEVWAAQTACAVQYKKGPDDAGPF